MKRRRSESGSAIDAAVTGPASARTHASASARQRITWPAPICALASARMTSRRHSGSAAQRNPWPWLLTPGPSSESRSSGKMSTSPSNHAPPLAMAFWPSGGG
jgi:hypothetical protein